MVSLTLFNLAVGAGLEPACPKRTLVFETSRIPLSQPTIFIIISQFKQKARHNHAFYYLIFILSNSLFLLKLRASRYNHKYLEPSFQTMPPRKK